LLKDYVDGRLLYCHPPPNCLHSKDFDPHEIAKNGAPAKLPDKLIISTEVNKIELDFDPLVPQKRLVSKRLKKHGRKGRKGRDKNPYEGSDIPGNVAYIHINDGGKKNNHRKDTNVIR
jgi:large subunit GTPase 1